MAYTKQTWTDLPSKTTPINASRLGHIEQGIYDAAATVDAVTNNLATKVDKSDVARIENGTSPTSDIEEGEQFYHNNILYKATQDIQTTDTITPNTNCRVSDSVTEQIQSGVESAYQLVEDSVGWTGKNLLKNYAVTQTINTVVFTRNNDGSITVNGTNSSSESIVYFVHNRTLDDLNMPAGDYTLSIGDVNLPTSIMVRALCTRNGSAVTYVDVRHGEGKFTKLAGDIVGVAIIVNGRAVANNYTVKPMVRYADIIDDTYEPYHASVDESKCDNSVIAPVENGSTASQAYAVGSHAIRNGAFITWKNAKAQGESINDESDYTSGDVTSCLIKQEAFTIITNAGGLANLTDQNNRIILRIDSANSKICFPYRTTGGTNNVIVFNNDMTIAANLEVSGTYYYI